jgi:amylosucrase
VWTTFYPYQWDLNYANPEVFLAIVDALLGLAARGVDVFRLDSVAFIWKRQGTASRNLPQAHALIEALRAAVDIAAPAVILKSEAIFKLDEARAFFGDAAAPEAQLAYNSSLMAATWLSLVEGTADAYRAILNRATLPVRQARWASYVRCHDDIGWGPLLADLATPDAEARIRRAAQWLHGQTPGSWSRGEPFQTDGAVLHGTNGALASLCGLDDPAAPASAQAQAVARVLLMQAATFASGGLPILFMGDEVGLTNDRSYLEDPSRAHEGRWLHRPSMNWSLLGGSGGAPNAAQEIFAGVRSLGAALRATDASGPARGLDSPNPALARLALGEDRVVLNFSAEPQAIAPDDAGWRDRLSGATTNTATVLAPYRVLWLTGPGDRG